MLFDFHSMRPVQMWMKNTLIPLDMLFVTESGALVQIERNTSPHSLDLITAVEPVRYVVEINGGEAQSLEITVGDRMLVHDIQSATDAR